MTVTKNNNDINTETKLNRGFNAFYAIRPVNESRQSAQDGCMDSLLTVKSIHCDTRPQVDEVIFKAVLFIVTGRSCISVNSAGQLSQHRLTETSPTRLSAYTLNSKDSMLAICHVLHSVHSTTLFRHYFPIACPKLYS